MGHDDEGHTTVGRHMPEELLECLQTASRGTDADDEIVRRPSLGIKTLGAALAPLSRWAIRPCLGSIVPSGHIPSSRSTCESGSAGFACWFPLEERTKNVSIVDAVMTECQVLQLRVLPLT